jgi:hypothetical protein
MRAQRLQGLGASVFTEMDNLKLELQAQGKSLCKNLTCIKNTSVEQ